MSKDKRSFFERLTGTVRMEKERDTQSQASHPATTKKSSAARTDTSETSWMDEDTEKEGELTVDVYQTPDSIVVKSMIAGVRPDDLDVTITRDMVTIRGK